MAYQSPYRHVPVPTQPDNEKRPDGEGVTLVKGREKRQRPKARPRAPGFHHGANPDQDKRISGELRCTLTALSPLLVPNQRVTVSNLSGTLKKSLDNWRKGIKKELDALVPTVARGQYENDRRYQARLNDLLNEINALCEAFQQEKQVIFPLQSGTKADAEVILPGEGIKGMVRQLIGSLSGSPLDRVGESTHSYRPNAKFPPDRLPLRSIPIAGRVLKDMREGSLELEIEPIVDVGKIQWVHGSTLKDAQGAEISAGAVLATGTEFQGKWAVEKSRRVRWKDAPRAQNPAEYERRNRCTVHTRTTGDACLLNVRDGVDAYQSLFQAHNSPKRRDPHPQALVPKALFPKGVKLPVEPAVVRQFLLSREHVVSDDADSGHLTVDKDISRKLISPPKKHSLPKKNDLMFFELLLPEPLKLKYPEAIERLLDGKIDFAKCRIIACGQNYYYRWRHADSAKTTVWGWDGREWKTELRPEFDPSCGEGNDGFFVVQNMLGQAKAAAGRSSMAGRVSINGALERVKPGATLKDRFCSGSSDRVVPFAVWLHPLTSAKGPSWAKGYVPGNESVRNDQLLKTLGDGIRVQNGKVEIQNASTASFGYKHFVHHKATLGCEEGPDRAHFDLPSFIEARDQRDDPPDGSLRIQRRKPLLSSQAAIAMRISKPGIEFGLTVRFKDLLPGELGVLALAINPDQLEGALSKVKDEMLRQTLEGKLAAIEELEVCELKRRFGLRLGHGKPLGLGSIAIDIDKAVSWAAGQGELDLLQCIADALEDGYIQRDALLATLEVLKLDSSGESYLSRELNNNGRSELDLARSIREGHSLASRKTGFPD